MARTKGRPGPKPHYGKRREYHILLAAEPVAGEALSLSDAFEEAASTHGGIIAYVEFVLKERPEIRERLSGHI